MLHPFAILNALPDGAIVLDRAGAVIFANDAARRLLGATQLDQAPGPAGWDWSHGPATFVHADQVFEISRTELPSDPPVYLLLYRDMTSHYRAEYQAGLLRVGIGSGVRGGHNVIDMLLRGICGDLSDQQRQVMAIAARTLKNTLAWVEFLDRWILADAGAVILDRAQISITEVIREAAAPFLAAEQEAPLEQAAAMMVSGDAGWLRHAFALLFDIIREKRTPFSCRIALDRQEAEVEITLCAELTRDPQATSFFSSARRLIELHGGTLTVAQQADQGTIFTIRLPIDAQA